VSGHFGAGLFAFLTDLAANNDRDWFRAHKQRYVDEVEAPLRRFVEDAGMRLAEISPSFAEGSPFRIYRDTRFSKAQQQFKTSAAAQFRHGTRRRDHSVPGFYLHLSPGFCMGGGGLYRPDAPALGRVRDRIVAHPDEWAAVLASGVALQGDPLKRAPAGYDPGHRFVADLRRKDHYAMTQYSEVEVCRADFLDAYVATCAGLAPLLAFLTRSLDLTW
jgi:uncharacterized protein (TIGR02453 family)